MMNSDSVGATGGDRVDDFAPTVGESPADATGPLRALCDVVQRDAGDDDETVQAWLRFTLRVASGSPTPADLDKLSFAFSQYLASTDGEAMEVLLGIPCTRDKRLQLMRNLWLGRAVALLERPGPWMKAVELEGHWKRFVTRGGWRRWRDQAEPPACADELERVLFWATRYNDGDFLSARQIDRVIRHWTGGT